MAEGGLLRATRKLRVLSRDQEVIADIREEQQFAQSDLANGRCGRDWRTGQR